MTHLDLLHRARTAVRWPESLLDKQALLRDLDEAITGAYPKRHPGKCWCGEPAVDQHWLSSCNEHTDQNVGDG